MATAGRATGADKQLKRAIRATWALGDYHRFATSLVWEVGQVMVDACGIAPGQRVLDVAAGTGDVAIRAAEAGAQVVASDLTPENFEAGRREARARGVELEWVEADAEALPFADGEFDAVTSTFGAMFSPDHQAVAKRARPRVPAGRPDRHGELHSRVASGRVLRGLRALCAATAARSACPGPVGSEAHVRELFGDRLASLELTRRHCVERATSARDYCEFFKETFGPVMSVCATLADEPDRAADLDREFLDFATRSNRGAAAGPAEHPSSTYS